MGLFAGGYKSVNCLLRKLLEEENKLNAFVAGATAGLSILVLDQDSRTPIALYLLVKALAMGLKAASKSYMFPSIFKLNNPGFFTVSLSASQILYCYLCNQEALPKSYGGFLNAAGRKSALQREMHYQTQFGLPFDRVKVDSHLTKLGHAAVNWAIPLSQAHPSCHVLHPEDVSCVAAYLRFVVLHFLQYSLRFYGPLNLSAFLLFQRRFTLSGLAQLAKSIVRSALFLAFYCGNSWAASCLLRNTNMLFGMSYLLVGFMAGSATIFETPSRSLELGLYCLSPALQSLCSNLVRWKVLPHVHYADTFAFMLAMGILMGSHQNNQTDMRKSYPTFAQIMKRLLGVD
jgi:hypothetical protein